MPEQESRRDRRLLIGAVAAGAFAVAAIALAVHYWPTTVPTVRTQTVEQARATLDAAKLFVGDVAQVATTAVGPGLIAQQSPAAGAQVLGHTSVDVTVAVTPARDVVPDAVGATIDDATATLESAGFLVVAIDVFDPPANPAVGTVLGQLPPANAQWMTGLPVGLTVAAGADDGTAVAIPDLVGANLDTATDELESVQLKLQGAIADPSASGNVVVQQLPAAGTLVRPGTTVLVLLGQK